MAKKERNPDLRTSIQFFGDLLPNGAITGNTGKMIKGDLKGATLLGLIIWARNQSWDWPAFMISIYDTLDTGLKYIDPDVDETVTMHPADDLLLIDALMPLMPPGTSMQDLLRALEFDT
jgi:hypothetical protein